MAATVTCPNPRCAKSYQVSVDYLGRRGRCKSCGTEFVFSDTNSGIDVASGSGSVSGAVSGQTGSNLGTTRAGRTQTPTRLGRFQILERVGMGGFGAVYRAQDPQLQRTVALKLLQTTGDESRDQHRINRFLIEGRAGARLQHPNIVPVFDAGKDEESGEYYMAAAFITGAPLSSAIDGQPLDLRRAATIVAQLARALDYAHAQGILHRDVKPDNVMLDEQDIPHLMDFGLARMEESESHLTRDGTVMGTPSYMSPEQCVGKQAALGPAADQYSLGCVFYELLTGDKLFEGPVSVQIHHQINTEAPPPSTKNASIPPDLDTICLKTLSKEPDRRYGSCADLAADLERWLADEPIHARQLTTWERWNRWRRRNPAIARLSLGLAAALVIGLLGITTQWIRAEAHARAATLAAEEERKATEAAKAAEQEATLAAEEQRKAKEAAEAAKQEAVQERRATQKQLAESYVQRGRYLCLEGDVAHGLLWMARGLQSMPAGETEAARLIALRIGAWEPWVPQRRLLVQHQKVIVDVAFEPQGKWFVTASYDHTARIWDAETGRPLSPPLQHGGEVVSVDIDDDGRSIVTSSWDSTVRVWSAPDGAPIGEPLRHSEAPTGAVLADGGVIVTRAGALHFWDAASRQPRREPIPVKAGLGKLCVTRDRRTIVLCSGQEVLTYDANGQEVGPRIQAINFSEVRGLAISPDGQTVLATGWTDQSRKGVWRTWEATGLRRSLQSLTDSPWTAVNDAVFSPDGKWLVMGSLNGSSVRRSAADLTTVGYPLKSAGPIRCVAYHPHEDAVVTGGDDAMASIWSLPRPQPERLRIQHPGGVYSAVLSPDNRRILSAGIDANARLWDAETGAAIGLPVPHPSAIIYARFSPDGQRIASGAGNSALHFHPTDAAAARRTLAHPSQVTGVAFNPSGDRLLTGCADGIARLWDVSSGQLVAQTEKHPHRIFPVDFSRDGRRFATASGRDTGQHSGEVRIFDAESRKLVAGPLSHSDMVLTVRFGHHDEWIATACSDGAARVWDIQTGQVVRGPFWHPAGVNVVELDPAEGMLVTSCGDGRVRFWDLDSQQQFGPDLVHDDMAVGVSLTADGRRLVTGSLDGTVRVWDVPQPAVGTPTDIERRIQRATGQRLSERGDLEFIDESSWLQLAPETKPSTND